MSANKSDLEAIMLLKKSDGLPRYKVELGYDLGSKDPASGIYSMIAYSL